MHLVGSTGVEVADFLVDLIVDFLAIFFLVAFFFVD